MRCLVRLSGVLAAILFATPVFAQIAIPEIPFESAPNFLKLPANLYFGEVVGVSVNSMGHVFVYSRTGSPRITLSTNRAFWRPSARLYEFDQNGQFVRELSGLYSMSFAHAVRVDPQDNVWVIDEGSSTILKLDPQWRIQMVLGRKPEALRVPTPPEQGEPGGGAGIPGDNFNRPTDVAWDPAGNIFISDGHGANSNARVAKFDKNGKFIKSWGSRGSGPGQFDTPHGIAVDANGNVYVADRSNKRIQVFDNDGNFKTQYNNVGTPFTLCITKGPRQYLYSANSNFPGSMENGEIYKMELDGRILGKFGHAGRELGDIGVGHSIECRTENEVYVAEVWNWRAQKLILHPERAKLAGVSAR